MLACLCHQFLELPTLYVFAAFLEIFVDVACVERSLLLLLRLLVEVLIIRL